VRYSDSEIKSVDGATDVAWHKWRHRIMDITWNSKVGVDYRCYNLWDF